jgi:membrane protease YdiL (CAAX protease family)
MLTLFIITLVAVICAFIWSQISVATLGPATIKRSSLDLFYKSTIMGTAIFLLAAAAVEELVFRYLMIGLNPWWTVHTWLILSIIFFALAHYWNVSDSNLPFCRLIPHFILGVMLAWVYIHYGFKAAWMVHFWYNMGVVLVSRYMFYRNPTAYLQKYVRVRDA